MIKVPSKTSELGDQNAPVGWAILGIILASYYIGIIISHCKDPY